MNSGSMIPERIPAEASALPAVPSRLQLVSGAVRYLLGKALLIALTIFIGVFITVLMVNQPTRSGLGPAKSPFEIGLEQQISSYLRTQSFTISDQAELDAIRQQLRSEAGLNLPAWQRQLLWTYKALTFDWGRLTVVNAAQLDFGRRSTAGARDIVLQYFPNTLLLMGTAYLLVFLIGIPLALYLSRHYGGRLDRVLTILSPLSSVPSWVIAILLIALFAVELRWLPVSGMFDAHKPEEPLQYAAVLLRHMLLPVAAIVISLLFQLVYAWRTFFVIHAEEDFVELARAKGLRPRVIESQYILRPALPYVITSFALSLIGFWQMTMALEVVFRWPGLGWLYINKALPNFWGESTYPGELIVAIGIVVIFAYLLGIVVFVLDLAYILVDPRIHLRSADTTLKAVSSPARGHKQAAQSQSLDTATPEQYGRLAGTPRRLLERLASGLADSFYAARDGAKFLFQHLSKDATAVFGMVVIALLFAGSAYAVIALPYEKIGRVWDSERLTGRASAPRLAAPAWTNLLAASPRLSTLILDGASQPGTTSPSALNPAWNERTTTYIFDYPYAEFPSEVYLYLDPTYTSKRPFVSLVWICPDGRRLDLKGSAVEGEQGYDFEGALNLGRLLAQHPEWRSWFTTESADRRPSADLLFAAPGSSDAHPLHGRYQLEVKSLLFESGSKVESQLVLLGQVYGLAGTDYWRRDLVIPLLWGMPFTLVFGLLGATATTILAMLLSAAGVWLGGWVDAFIQRFTEVNMVLPVLAIGILANAVLGISLWVVLGVIVLLNVFGVPARTFRSAFLQEKEAPYIEAARAYGAGNARIISRYLVPRILPMLIPQLVILVPSFVFLEATLGLFNIQSSYPTWGRIISEGLSKGALYGSRFWVLEPISLLLLTGLAFAMFGSALERALNPRMGSRVAVVPHGSESSSEGAELKQTRRLLWNPGMTVLTAVLALVLLAAVWMRVRDLRINPGLAVEPTVLAGVPGSPVPTGIPVDVTLTPQPFITSQSTSLPASPAAAELISPTPMTSVSPTLTATAVVVTQPTLTPSANAALLASYRLQRGEFPYCIARRLNVDPNELLSLSGLLGREIFPAGTLLQIPQTGKPFPGERMLRLHPAFYSVSRSGQTLYGVACTFGDIDPLLIAQSNNLPVDSQLYKGQQLQIP